MNILFVCTGNTCRSCMAEAIFNSLVKKDKFYASSAGIATIKNSKTSVNASLVIKKELNLDISKRKAVQINEILVKDNFLILTMTEDLRNYLIKTFPKYKDRIYLLNDYVGTKEDVLDPYGDTMAIYENTFSQLKNSILLLLNKLKEDKSV